MAAAQAVRRLLDVNTLSYIHAATEALAPLQASRGSIVVVSSAAGKMGMPNVAPYAASKHALRLRCCCGRHHDGAARRVL